MLKMLASARIDTETLVTAAGGRTGTSGPWILVAAILGSSMVFIDGTVINVALPALQNAFQTTGSNLQWII